MVESAWVVAELVVILQIARARAIFCIEITEWAVRHCDRWIWLVRFRWWYGANYFVGNVVLECVAECILSVFITEAFAIAMIVQFDLFD